MGQSPPPGPPERSRTVIESDEDIRRALLGGLHAAPTPVPEPPPPVAARGASPYRPTARPPVPILTVFDDGKSDGETIRLREPKFVIGRTEGHLRFPLDGRMSAKHVEITHQNVGGRHRWVVTDLQSTHGLFVRVSRAALADRAEFLVGGGRYRFEAARVDTDQTADHGTPGADSSRTRGLDEGATPFRPAALTELIGREIGNRLLLVKDEYWIGADPSCAVCRPDDPFCEPRHVRLSRSGRGHWTAEHDRTPNGLWLRMPQVVAESVVHFQVGEQRFRLRLP